ncbi:RluA family pseudouridine synthase [Candidatus Saccharibacteria bacterium]|nr:RluA family pseudouridine synthase [Candidatus Saccharibacteria bacterium]
MPKKFSKSHLSRIINGDIELSEAPEKTIKTRLDIALQTKYPQYNRSTIKKYIKAGQVSINENLADKPNTLVTETDNLKIHLPTSNSTPKPPVIYEDNNVIVLDKPVGLLTVSKGDFNPEPTLESYGLAAHRLDRDTSGVIILAKNDQTKSALQKQFQDRKTHKTYYAIVVGYPKLDEAIINIPLARNLKAPTTFQPNPEGREAITQYKVIEQNDKYSLLELKPQTGRTHQLRVHLAHIGTPILGDKIYGKTPADRMYLHATELEITIPKSQRKIFTSKLPESFQNVLEKH